MDATVTCRDNLFYDTINEINLQFLFNGLLSRGRNRVKIKDYFSINKIKRKKKGKRYKRHSKRRPTTETSVTKFYIIVGKGVGRVVEIKYVGTRERWVAAVLGVNEGKKEGRCIIAQRCGRRIVGISDNN